MFRWSKSENLNAKTVWKNSLTYTVLLAALGAMVFFGVCDPRRQGGGSLLPSGDAVKVAGHEISAASFRRTYRNVYERYQQQMKDKFDPKSLNLSSHVVDQLVDELILVSEAEKSGISVGSDEIAELIGKAEAFKDEKGKFDPARFDQYLNSQGYTEKSFEEELQRSMVSDKFRRFISESYFVPHAASTWNYRIAETKYDVEYLKIDPNKLTVEVTEDEVTKFLGEADNKKKVEDHFAQNKGEFSTPKKVHALHILSSFAGARNASGDAAKRSKEEAKKRAENIQKLATEPNAKDFKILAEEFTDDPQGKKGGGSLGYFKYEDMVPEFSKAAFELAKGTVSGVVESPFGFHVIKVIDVKDAKDTPQDQAYREIAKSMIKKQKGPLVATEKTNSLLSLIKENKPIDQELKALDIHWATTNPFSPESPYVPGIGSKPEIKEAVFKLTKPGQLTSEAVDISGSKFILRLKSLEKPDMSKLTAEKLDEIATTQRYTEAYSLYNAINDTIKEKYKMNGSVWVNESFRMFDSNRNSAAGS